MAVVLVGVMRLEVSAIHGHAGGEVREPPWGHTFSQTTAWSTSAATPVLHLHGGGATSAGTWCPRRGDTNTTSRSLPSNMRPPGMAVRKAPVGPPDELRSLTAPHCPWVVLRAKLDSMSAWQVSSPFLLTSCCARRSPFLLSRNSVGRSFAASSHLHSSGYRRGGCATAPARRRHQR